MDTIVFIGLVAIWTAQRIIAPRITPERFAIVHPDIAINESGNYTDYIVSARFTTDFHRALMRVAPWHRAMPASSQGARWQRRQVRSPAQLSCTVNNVLGVQYNNNSFGCTLDL